MLLFAVNPPSHKKKKKNPLIPFWRHPAAGAPSPGRGGSAVLQISARKCWKNRIGGGGVSVAGLGGGWRAAPRSGQVLGLGSARGGGFVLNPCCLLWGALGQRGTGATSALRVCQDPKKQPPAVPSIWGLVVGFGGIQGNAELPAMRVCRIPPNSCRNPDGEFCGKSDLGALTPPCLEGLKSGGRS